jgi:hypothetical protein
MMIERAISNQTVAIGPFMSALKYVLEMKLGVPCTIYGTEYGELDFSVRAIRFRFQWQPKNEQVQLICKHMEGDKFIKTPFDPMSSDPLQDLVEVVEVSLNSVSPFDTE